MKTEHARSIRKGIEYAETTWRYVTAVTGGGLRGYNEYRYRSLGKIQLSRDPLARTAYEMYAYKRGWVTS